MRLKLGKGVIFRWGKKECNYKWWEKGGGAVRDKGAFFSVWFGRLTCKHFSSKIKFLYRFNL